MAQTTCSQCDAQYYSERELRDHLVAAHRTFSSEQSSSEPGETQFEVLVAPVNEPVK
jgi:hypothetical protein